MPKASPALIVALLLVAALAAPASVGGVSLLDSTSTAAAPSEGISENTTRVLQLTEIRAAGFGEPSVVVLDAASIQETELDTAYSIARLRERLSAAPNRTVRERILENTTEAVAEDITELRAAERSARLDFVQGDITAGQYLQRLATIHARAEHLARFVGGTVYPQPNLWSLSAPYRSVQQRTEYLQEEIQILTGPVRDRMAAAVTGQQPAVRVFVAANEDGFTVSYIEADSRYIRETFRADNLDTNTSGGQNVSELLRMSTRLYPWSLENRDPQNADLNPPHGSAEITITHPHGRVIANIDFSTEQVYYEIQYKRLDALPVEYTFNRTKNDTRVLVSKTYPGGPLQVRMLNVSGENTTARIDVPVTVNETTTHRTGLDGSTWFISPAGEYNVTTAYNGTKFHFNVTA